MSFHALDGADRGRFVGRFVTVCQQLLTLAVVCAVLTPAARVITMDVRPMPAGGAGAASADAYLRSASAPSKVPTVAVDPEVDEYSLTAPTGARLAPGALRAQVRRTATGGTEITTDALPVDGYGTIGVTWGHDVEVAERAIGLKARTRDGGTWSGWTPLVYHDDHAPDPGTREARRARPGTDALLIGDVDRVQVRIVTEKAAPADMKLAVIDPGKAATTARQKPAIDTAALAPDGSSRITTSSGEVALATADPTPKPKIYSRAQWGADERLRDKPSLHYYEVHAGFVHHTVNANDYTRSEVPGIIRGIYAYHTRSRGWSDVGYNFLVDKFGRIWEGRYGGVGRPVVGAHTLGYNDDSFAMSAIGNFETAKPKSAMIKAYGALFAWKLSLHGVDASSTRQYVTSRYFQAINGHRDAGSTACPGKYLYAKLDRIRTLAAQDQVGWAGRELESDVTGSPLPDLIVRRASDGRGFVVPIKQKKSGALKLAKPIDAGVDLSDAKQLLKAGDWDRDGNVDLLVRRKGSAERLYLYRGLGTGRFAEPTLLTSDLSKVRLLAAVGDVTGDGWPDLMGQPKGGVMRIYPGKGLNGLRASYVAHSAVPGRKQIPIGLWGSDGAPDSLVRNDGTLTLWTGNGPGGWTNSRRLATSVRGLDWVLGVSSVDGNATSDLITRNRATGEIQLLPRGKKGLGAPIVLGTLTGYDKTT